MVKLVEALTTYAIHWALHLLFKPTFYGIHNLPNKPFILAANHTAKIDPFFLCALPYSVMVGQLIPIYFVTAEKYMRKWYLYPILKGLGCVRIKQKAWTLEEYYHSSISVLRRNQMLMVFPEGRIVKGDRDKIAKAGVGYLIREANVPVVPLKITWNKKPYNLTGCTLTFGTPIHFKKTSKNIKSYGILADSLLETIYALKP